MKSSIHSMLKNNLSKKEAVTQIDTTIEVYYNEKNVDNMFLFVKQIIYQEKKKWNKTKKMN